MDFERTSIKEAEDCHCQCRRSNARCHRFDVTQTSRYFPCYLPYSASRSVIVVAVF
jgi:hypothetical protein